MDDIANESTVEEELGARNSHVDIQLVRWHVGRLEVGPD